MMLITVDPAGLDLIVRALARQARHLEREGIRLARQRDPRSGGKAAEAVKCRLLLDGLLLTRTTPSPNRK